MQFLVLLSAVALAFASPIPEGDEAPAALPMSTMPPAMSLLTTPLLLFPTFMMPLVMLLTTPPPPLSPTFPTPPATLPLPTFTRSPSLPLSPSPPPPSPTPPTLTPTVPTPTTMLTPTPLLPTTLAASTTLAAWCPAPKKSFNIETKRPTEDRKGHRTTREQELDIGGHSVGPTDPWSV